MLRAPRCARWGCESPYRRVERLHDPNKFVAQVVSSRLLDPEQKLVAEVVRRHPFDGVIPRRQANPRFYTREHFTPSEVSDGPPSLVCDIQCTKSSLIRWVKIYSQQHNIKSHHNSTKVSYKITEDHVDFMNASRLRTVKDKNNKYISMRACAR